MPEPIAEQSKFEASYEHDWLPVFRFALAWTNDWQSAEDIAQDAFSRLWTNRNKIDWGRPVLPWLLTTTRRLATDRFRRLTRLTSLSGRGDPSSPRLDSEARVRWLDIRARMAELPPMQRGAAVLVGMIGFTPDEAALVLDTSPGAVRAALSRARGSLATE